jgi:hypothetical protein
VILRCLGHVGSERYGWRMHRGIWQVACLMALLVHLRILSVRRLRVTAAVTIGTVVCVAIWSGILSHALRKTRALCAILRSGVVAGSGRLIPNRWELSVWRGLSRHTNSLSHLTINWSFARGRALVSTLLCIGTVTFIIGLALRLFLLLLRFPLFANLLELYKVKSAWHSA